MHARSHRQIETATFESAPVAAGQWNDPEIDPIAATIDAGGDAVLAFIVHVDGPSYRPVGAAMAILAPDHRIGTLSSGCIESDITVHALAARDTGRLQVIRYGRGSPYKDIQLPCGGGMDILLLPRPNLSVLRQVQNFRRSRQSCTLDIDLRSGEMAVSLVGQTVLTGDRFSICFEPELQFQIFGKGPEASTFAKLVQSAGYPNLLLSPDSETLEGPARGGCATRLLVNPLFPVDLAADDRTAVVLFFHDHDWEPLILKGALETEAFYIGAQGSARARAARIATLADMGLHEDQMARLSGPVGLIPSARDATTLAVSVLAEVLAQAMPQPRA